MPNWCYHDCLTCRIESGCTADSSEPLHKATKKQLLEKLESQIEKRNISNVIEIKKALNEWYNWQDDNDCSKCKADFSCIYEFSEDYDLGCIYSL